MVDSLLFHLEQKQLFSSEDKNYAVRNSVEITTQRWTQLGTKILDF